MHVLLCLLALSASAGSAPAHGAGATYGDTPGAQRVKGSYGQAVRTVAVNFDVQDVRQAIIKAAGFDGLEFDVAKENMMSGSTQWTPPGFTGGCTPRQVYAVYITPVAKRQSSVTIVVDHMSLCASGMHSPALLVQRLVSNMNTVLATYE